MGEGSMCTTLAVRVWRQISVQMHKHTQNLLYYEAFLNIYRFILMQGQNVLKSFKGLM